MLHCSFLGMFCYPILKQRALGKVKAHLLQEIEDQRSLPGGFFDDAPRRKIIDCGGPLITNLLFIAPPPKV